jgi:hypothetical protein
MAAGAGKARQHGRKSTKLIIAVAMPWSAGRAGLCVTSSHPDRADCAPRRCREFKSTGLRPCSFRRRLPTAPVASSHTTAFGRPATRLCCARPGRDESCNSFPRHSPQYSRNTKKIPIKSQKDISSCSRRQGKFMQDALAARPGPVHATPTQPEEVSRGNLIFLDPDRVPQKTRRAFARRRSRNRGAAAAGTDYRSGQSPPASPEGDT